MGSTRTPSLCWEYSRIQKWLPRCKDTPTKKKTRGGTVHLGGCRTQGQEGWVTTWKTRGRSCQTQWEAAAPGNGSRNWDYRRMESRTLQDTLKNWHPTNEKKKAHHIFQCSLNIYKHYQYIRSDQKGNLKFQEKLLWVTVVTIMLLYWPREVPFSSWPHKPLQTPRTRNVKSNWWDPKIHKAYLLTLKAQCDYKVSKGHQEMDSVSLLVWWVHQIFFYLVILLLSELLKFFAFIIWKCYTGPKCFKVVLNTPKMSEIWKYWNPKRNNLTGFFFWK